MFSSGSSFNPFQITTNQLTMINGGLVPTATQNPSSSSIQDHDHYSSLFLHFASPFVDDNDLLISEYLSQQQILGSNTILPVEDHLINPADSNMERSKETRINTSNKRKRSDIKGSKQAVPRKRNGKKDRHSKIYTAQGPRDRRMRLSLEVARKFFDLQDMLGFDKASKTIEWLFTKSKAAIREVTDGLASVKKNSSSDAKSVSSTSESEVVSGVKLRADRSEKGEIVAEKAKKSEKPVLNSVARESRDKARERARERTREKMKIKVTGQPKQYCQENPSNFEQLGHCSPLRNNTENLGYHNQEIMGSPLKDVVEQKETQHQMDSVSIMDKLFEITTAPRSYSVFNFSHNVAVQSGASLEEQFSEFPGLWEMNSARCRAIPSMNLSTGNVHVQNFNAILMSNPSSQDQNTSNTHDQTLASIFLTASRNAQEQNPNPSLLNISNPNEQNPNSSFLMATTDTGLYSHFTANQFSCNMYDSLY